MAQIVTFNGGGPTEIHNGARSYTAYDLHFH